MLFLLISINPLHLPQLLKPIPLCLSRYLQLLSIRKRYAMTRPPDVAVHVQVGTIAPLLQANRSSQNANPRWIWRGWDAFGVPTSRGSGAHVGSTSGEFEVKIGSLLWGTNHHSAIHEFLEVQECTKIICLSGWIPGWIWICSSHVLQS